MPRAYRDLTDLYIAINAEHSAAADKWFDGLDELIESLSEQPSRGSVIGIHDGIRNLHHAHRPQIYSVIYRVFEKERRVEVLQI
jgi:plasmid stabilization system protein ParE